MRWVGGSGSQLGEEQDSGAIKMAMGAAAGAAASGSGSAGQAVSAISSKKAQDANAKKQENKDDKNQSDLLGALSQANSPTPPAEGQSRGANNK